MNERILELAREAGLLVHNPEGVPTKLEKFAQLIVAECVAQCEFVAGQAEITNTGEMARKTKATANSCAQMIEQQFGVKE